jgi:ferredoxin-NADP reductase
MGKTTIPKTSSLSIGALSKHTGCNIETVRYYERIGMLPEPPRTGAVTEFMARTISNGSYLSAVAANSALTWKTCVDCYALLTAGTTPAPRSGV